MRIARWIVLTLICAGCSKDASSSVEDAGVQPAIVITESCLSTGCSGLAWCDPQSGLCQPGCGDSSQCAPGEQCSSAHACECVTGFHRCDGVCVDDAAVESCGSACSPCEARPHADVACVTGACEYTCQDGAKECDGQCAVCPTTGVSTTVCNGTACVPASCAAGHLLCDGTCAACPSNGVSEVRCEAAQCVAETCKPGFVTCDGACVACAKGEEFCCTEPVDQTPDAGTYLSMDISKTDGTIAVAYHAYKTEDLLVATHRPGTTGWTIERPVPNQSAGVGASLAIGANGTLHVSFYSGGRMTYARKENGAWKVEVVDPSPIWASGRSSLRLDASGAPRVAYWVNNSLHYAERNGTAWDWTEVDAWAGEVPELAIDASGAPHISYSISGNQIGGPGSRELKYAHRANGTWTSSTLFSAMGLAAATRSTIAVEKDGTLRVLYYDVNWHELRELSKPPGQPWTPYQAVPVAKVADGTGARLTVAPDGTVHAVWAGHDFAVNYATRTNGTWTSKQVGTALSPEPNLALAFDSTGLPHVAWWTRGSQDSAVVITR